jgi:Protein of unknown function (DUF2950)
MSRSVKRMFRRIVFAATFSAFLVIIAALASTPVGSRKQTSSKQATPPPVQEQQGKSFASPEDAAAMLHTAANTNDEDLLLVIFGPGAKEAINWSNDSADRQAEYRVFAQKYDQMHRLVKEPDGTVSLHIGAENWPLPTPLVENNGAWYFDIDAGKNEILYRRIGRNEVEAMEVSRALVDAEKDYYAGAHQYTQKFISTAGAHDGLYWPESNAAANSPIGPFLAHADFSASDDVNRMPFHGYYYRILVSQGPNAPGGARNYIVDGEMTGGFAILAFPAQYRSSGVMTFITGQDGAIYERDLGPTTEKLAQQIDQYNPDSTWKVSQ